MPGCEGAKVMTVGEVDSGGSDGEAGVDAGSGGSGGGEGLAGDEDAGAFVEREGGGVFGGRLDGEVVELELADGVREELGGAAVGDGEGRGAWQGDGSVRDGCGCVVREIEVAGEACGSGVLGAEVDLSGGEVEGGGLGVFGELDAAGAEVPVGLGDAVAGGVARCGEAEGDVAGAAGGEELGGAGAGGGAVAGLLGEGVGGADGCAD